MDHLHCNTADQNKFWQYPSNQDKQQVLHEQIINIEIKGYWTMDERNNRYVLTNKKEIMYEFKQSTEKVI